MFIVDSVYEMDPEQIIKEGVQSVVDRIPGPAYYYGTQTLINKICSAVYYDESDVNVKDKIKKQVLDFVAKIVKDESGNTVEVQKNNNALLNTINEKLNVQNNAIFKDSYLNACILEKILKDDPGMINGLLTDMMKEIDTTDVNAKNIDEKLMAAIAIVSNKNESNITDGGKATKRLNKTRKHRNPAKQNKTKKHKN
jgi:hypothetical protein